MARVKNKKVVYLNGKRKTNNFRKIGDVQKIALVAGAIFLGLVFAFWPNGYMVSIGGSTVGAIDSQDAIEKSLEAVIAGLSQTYNTNVKLTSEDDISVSRTRVTNRNKITTNYLMTYMRNNMDFELEFKELYVDGEKIGIIESEEMLDNLLKNLTKEYYGDSTIKTEFANDIRLEAIFAKEDALISMEKLMEIATQTTPADVEYEIKAGDTLWSVATSLGITIADLVDANEGLTETSRIVIGKTLNAEVQIPKIDVDRVE
ncbi:MAG: hypothetical protein ATN35_03100 [Epulopiscium sp. Nele67-Bin004]|nr:MAG: hypothetical protein ATN35_03100 [Epulopiscium sp. Nele67-Bin004]